MTRVVVVRERPSAGAMALVEELRSRGVHALKVNSYSRVRPGDYVISWGGRREDRVDKLQELEALRDAGIPTVEFTLDHPTEGVWLGRSKYHSQGLDLSRPPRNPDYWVRKEEITREVRVHIWDGLSIRAGVKVQTNPGGEADGDWIRAHRYGWTVRYTGVRSDERALAKRAVEALECPFAAVDIAHIRRDGERDVRDEDHECRGGTVYQDEPGGVGSLLVLEVNRAPGIEGGTAARYADQIVKELENG